MIVIARFDSPLFLMVTGLTMLMLPTARLPNARLGGVSVMGEFAVPDPVPNSVTNCGLPVALSLKVTLPFILPRGVGVNVTFSVQEALAASVAPQPPVVAAMAV